MQLELDLDARAGHCPPVDAKQHGLDAGIACFVPSSSVAALSSDNGICIGSVGTDTGPGTTSGRALAWAASTP
jgi:hypothetical protein